MTTSAMIILVCIGLLVIAAYGREYHDDSLRKYSPKKKRHGRTYKR